MKFRTFTVATVNTLYGYFYRDIIIRIFYRDIFIKIFYDIFIRYFIRIFYRDFMGISLIPFWHDIK